MAYYAGFAFCVVAAVALVWVLGPIIGGIAAFSVVSGVIALLSSIQKRHYDPMAPYQAERRTTRPR